MWTRRARPAYEACFGPNRTHPNPPRSRRGDRILGWAASYVTDPDWFIQKASRGGCASCPSTDATPVEAFLEAHGQTMKPFARKEAGAQCWAKRFVRTIFVSSYSIHSCAQLG